jgi:hypothetical protein
VQLACHDDRHPRQLGDGFADRTHSMSATARRPRLPATSSWVSSERSTSSCSRFGQSTSVGMAADYRTSVWILVGPSRSQAFINNLDRLIKQSAPVFFLESRINVPVNSRAVRLRKAVAAVWLAALFQ